MNPNEVSTLLERRIPLSKPAIGLAFVDEQPDGVDGVQGAAPSSCAFWREAESRVFYASDEDHFNCPLGAMVMGFDLPESQMSQLMAEVGMMCESSYVREEEVPHVPKVDQQSSGIVYGPLSQMPMEPDVALLWVTPVEAMVVGEAAGLINWAAPPATVYGRPGCGAIPIALSTQAPSQSLGCTGMRINSRISGEYMLIAIPGDAVSELADSVSQMKQTHTHMEAHYTRKIEELER